MDQELDTSVLGPGEKLGWPDAIIMIDEERNGNGNEGREEGVDVDAFILRTLTAATKGPGERRGSEGGLGYGMKIPGTPVKKVKTSHLGGDGGRPWQSAVAAKVGGFGFDLDLKGKVPRKSMPAVFSWRGKSGGGVGDVGGDTESEGEEDSPSFRKEARYERLGIGMPGGGAFSKTRWLMRRSSSGIFSSGNDISPTKPQGKVSS